MRRRAVITGAGVVSPLGDSPAKLHAALCQGRTAVGPVTLFSTEGLGFRQAAEMASFSPQAYLGNRNIRPLDRTAQLAAAAAEMALAASGWSVERRAGREVGLVLGTMFCSVHTICEFDRRALEAGPEYASPLDFANTVINAAAGQVAIWGNLRGVNSTIAAGPTSGLQAIAYAADLVRGGVADAVLAGGAEELCFESFRAFDRAGMLCRPEPEGSERPLPFDARRTGFVLGEGAALVMIEDAESATARDARGLAEIAGHGSACDGRPDGEGPPAGEGIAESIRLALADARMAAGQIDCLSASASGSVVADAREARGIRRALGERARDLPLTAIKSMLGEALGASGALQVIDMLEALRDGILPGIAGLQRMDPDLGLDMARAESRAVHPRRALVDSVGWDGNSCAVVLASDGQAG